MFYLILYLLLIIVIGKTIYDYNKLQRKNNLIRCCVAKCERNSQRKPFFDEYKSEEEKKFAKTFLSEIDKVLKRYYPDIITWKISGKHNFIFDQKDFFFISIRLKGSDSKVNDTIWIENNKIVKLYHIGWLDENYNLIPDENRTEEQKDRDMTPKERLYATYLFDPDYLANLNTGEKSSCQSCNNKKEDGKIGYTNVLVPDGPYSFQEIDVLLLSHHGIFCIESKEKNGKLFINDWTGDWKLRNEREDVSVINPLKQNMHHVMALQNLIYKKLPNLRRDIPFYNIVHLVNDRYKGLTLASEPIRSVSDQLKVDGEMFINWKLDVYFDSFNTKENVLTDEELQQISEIIKPYGMLSESEKKHYMAVRKDYLNSNKNKTSKVIYMYKHEDNGNVALVRKNSVYAQIYNPDINKWCYIPISETKNDVKIEDPFEIMQTANHKMNGLWE